MPTFIEVKVHAPTNTRGKRISCKASGKPRRVYPWAYEAGFRENLRAAAAWYAQDVLNATEYSVRVLGMVAVESPKNDLPIGYAVATEPGVCLCGAPSPNSVACGGCAV